MDEIRLMESAKWGGKGIKLGETGGLNVTGLTITNFGIAFWIMFEQAGFNHAANYDHYVNVADRTVFECQNTRLDISDDGALRFKTYNQNEQLVNDYYAAGTIQPGTLYFISCGPDGLRVNGDRWIESNCRVASISLNGFTGLQIGPNLNATIYDLAITSLGQHFTTNQLNLLYNGGKGCDMRKTTLLATKTYENLEFIELYYRMDSNIEPLGRYLTPVKGHSSRKIYPINFTGPSNIFQNLKGRMATTFEI